MNLTLIHLVSIVTAVLLFIFSLFALTYKKGNALRHKILAAFLFSNALYLVDFSLNVIDKITGLSLHWFSGIGTTFGFLFGPLLFLYTLAITNKDFTLRRMHLLHFILFLILFLLVIVGAKIRFIYQYGALHLQTTPYMIACFVVILHFRKKIKNYYSSVEKLNLTWMLYAVGGFFFMWMTDLLDFLLGDLGVTNHLIGVFLVLLSLSINFFFAILIFYKALQQPEILAGSTEPEKGHKYEQSRLTEQQKQEYLQKLESYFLLEKPFLNPEVTIAEGAEAINIHSKYLSQAINESLGKNFYDFINSYRIEEAKKQFTQENGARKTVLEVLYESGFNSKSSFNSAFKKHTGITPTEFKKQQFQMNS